MTKKTLTAKVSPKTLERLEEWAEDKGISKSEATNRLLDKCLDIEEDDKTIVMTDGEGAEIGNQLNEVDQQLEQFNQDYVRDSKNRAILNLLIAFAFIWIIVEIAVGFGSIGVVLTGVPLVASLIYFSLRTWW